MKIGIIGSRNIAAYSIEKMVLQVPLNCTEIISGGAKGIDSLACTVAQVTNSKFTQILPEYEKYGRQAPILRNEKLVKSCDLVLAFWDLHSRGTATAINLCIYNRIPFKIIPIN